MSFAGEQTVHMHPVDSARAVFRGRVVVGHRDSPASGRMYWALHGRESADSDTLRMYDPAFSIIAQPTDEELASIHHKLTKAANR